MGASARFPIQAGTSTRWDADHWEGASRNPAVTALSML